MMDRQQEERSQAEREIIGASHLEAEAALSDLKAEIAGVRAEIARRMKRCDHATEEGYEEGANDGYKAACEDALADLDGALDPASNG